MSDVAEFLKARLDEDEAVAKRSASGFTDGGPFHTVDCGVHLGYWAELDCICDGPARVLREVEAKRYIITLFPHPADGDGWNNAGEEVLTALATAYSDHPDFREEWRP